MTVQINKTHTCSHILRHTCTNESQLCTNCVIIYGLTSTLLSNGFSKVHMIFVYSLNEIEVWKKVISGSLTQVESIDQCFSVYQHQSPIIIYSVCNSIALSLQYIGNSFEFFYCQLIYKIRTVNNNATPVYATNYTTVIIKFLHISFTLLQNKFQADLYNINWSGWSLWKWLKSPIK